MTVLHLVRKLGQRYPPEVIREHEDYEDVRVRIVYLQDGVYLPRLESSSGQLEEYVLGEDLSARGLSDDRAVVTYGELLDLIFESDRVVSW